MLYRFKGLEKRSADFRRAFLAMATRLDINPNHLGAVIQTESGWDPHVPNVFHRHVLKRPIDRCAYGLIQFLPGLLRHYGTSATELSQHDAIWQLQFVERFYSVHAGKICSPGMAYMATFLPAFMAEDPSFVLGVEDSVTAMVDEDGHLILNGEGVGVGTTGEDPLGYGLRLGAVYEQNSGFDLNDDGVIVISEVTATAERNYDEARARGVYDDRETEPPPPAEDDDDEIPDTEPDPGLHPAPVIPFRLQSTVESRREATEGFIRRQDDEKEGA